MERDPLAEDSERRINDAAAQRRAERSRRSAAHSRLSVRSLLDAAQRDGREVTIGTVAGVTRRVVIAEVGSDGFVARARRDALIVMRTSHLFSLDTDQARLATAAERSRGGGDATFVDLVSRWIPLDTTIIARSGNATVHGTLGAVGVDVVAVATTPTTLTYLSVDSLEEVSASSS